jgi:hypothetical protein
VLTKMAEGAGITSIKVSTNQHGQFKYATL